MIHCIYRLNNPFYQCDLELSNPLGRDDFEFITGDHIGSLLNEDVVFVSSRYQNSLNVPQIICQQFPNLDQLWVERTQVEVLSENSFKNCKVLTILSLNENQIAKVPGMIFQTNSNLIWLQMRDNKIEEINENAFYGEYDEVTVIGTGGNELDNYFNWFIL